MNFRQCQQAVFSAIIFTGIILVSGCGTTQPTDFYQLNDAFDPSLQGVEKGPVVGVGPIELAEYINRPQIVTRMSDHQLQVSEFHRWIEPLKDTINRLLVTSISNQLNSNRVYGLPRSERQYPLELRVAIDIRRLDGQLGKSVHLETYWSLFDKDDRPLMSRLSIIDEPVAGMTYDDLVKSMNKTLQTLGTEISRAALSSLNSAKE